MLLTMMLVGVLSAACGSGDDDSGGEAPTSSTKPATTLVSPPPSALPTTSTTISLTSTSTTTAGAGTAALGASSTLDLRGLGPVRVGMTPAEATAAAGVPVVAPPGAVECAYAKAEAGPAGVLFMVVEGRIARVDVRAGSPVKTLSGAGVGDSEADVQARYAGRLEVSVHKYVPGGHYLTLVPVDAGDAELRLIFETDGSQVTAMRSGKLPEVGYVEGCS